MDMNLDKNRRLKYIAKLAESGVKFTDPETAYIDEGVKIGQGTLIGPCVTITGKSVIGEDCSIDQNCRIEDSLIGDECRVMSSYVLESSVGKGTSVGPFAYIRPGTKVGENCRIGDFVEVKNSVIGDGTKAAHLTYIGDADLGKGINLGCGVVFVNYDGSGKYRAAIEDNAFIGCNSNIVSPVKVGEGAYIAAGSTVTEDIKPDALYIARARGTQKENWVAKRGIWKNNK